MWWRWGFVGVLIGFLCAPLPNASADPGLIYACVQQGSNQVRIVSGPGQCRKPETQVTWSIQGPVGPAGPQGPKGETGPAGPLGVYAPAVVDVMCPKQSINGALRTASGNPLTIQVHGTCSESITITRNDVTLSAIDGATLTSPDPTMHAIYIVGAQRVQITNFILKGAGIEATDGAYVTLIDNTVSGAPENGVHILGNSTATLLGNTVQNAAGIGVAVEFGSSAFLGYNSQGIGNTLTHNGLDGLELYANSTAILQGTRITYNAQRDTSVEGVGVMQASSLRSFGDNLITDNNGVGIYVKASVLRIGPGGTNPYVPDQIARNNGGGIFAGENATGDVRNIIIENNTYNSNWSGYGLFVTENSHMRLSQVTIRSQYTPDGSPGGGGIRLQTNSSVRFRNPASTVPSMNCRNNGYDTGSAGQPSLAGSAPAGLAGVNGCYQF